MQRAAYIYISIFFLILNIKLKKKKKIEKYFAGGKESGPDFYFIFSTCGFPAAAVNALQLMLTEARPHHRAPSHCVCVSCVSFIFVSKKKYHKIKNIFHIHWAPLLLLNDDGLSGPSFSVFSRSFFYDTPQTSIVHYNNNRTNPTLNN